MGELETRLNRSLKKIHRGYAVKNLKQLPSGEYWFDLAMAFYARDRAKVNRVFADLLSQGSGSVARPCRRSSIYRWALTHSRGEDRWTPGGFY
jgi:hypothetical protein